MYKFEVEVCSHCTKKVLSSEDIQESILRNENAYDIERNGDIITFCVEDYDFDVICDVLDGCLVVEEYTHQEEKDELEEEDE